MKKNRLVLILGLMVISSFYCSKKDKITNPGDNHAGSNIGINATEENPYGLDSLLVAPANSFQLQAATLVPATPPGYQWSVGNGSIFQLIPFADDSSKVTVVALGDSGAVTTITVKDTANNQQKTLTVKVAVWADMQNFTYVGSLNKHHYFVSKKVADWATAQGKSEQNYGHLVTIQNAEENTLVKKGRTMVNADVWIGVHFQYDITSADRSKDLKWTLWVTGEPVDYKNWASGKPDFNALNQDWDVRYFAYMDAVGKWVNAHAMTKYYVLEIP